MPGMTLMDFPQAMHQCPHADLMNLASVYILRQQFYPKLKQNILFRKKVQLNKHIIVLTKYMPQIKYYVIFYMQIIL